MTMTTRAAIWLLTLTMVLAPGCGQARPRIGLVLINLQALFFNQLREGAEKAAAEAGVDLKIIDGNNDPARQVQGVESLVTQRAAAIIVVAVDPEGIKSAVAAARDEGIAVVGVDARVSVPPARAFVGVDNRRAGAKAGTDLVRLVDETLGGTARIGVVGAFNSLIQNERRDGFLDAVRASPGIAIAGMVDSRNVQEQALTAAENLVTANQQLDFIYATGEPALIGAIAAVESQGRTDRVRIIGWDLSPQAIRGLRQGFVHAVIQQDAYQQGYQAVVAALKLHRGEAVPEETFVPITIVTRQNVDRFEHMFGQ